MTRSKQDAATGSREGKTMIEKKRWIAGFAETMARFRHERGGIAAVEFAFIAPVLLTMYFVTMEIGLGIEANKKVGRTASIVADLVTQNQTVTRYDIDSIMRIGESTMQPYNRSVPEIRVTAIQISDDESNPRGIVTWSRKAVGTNASNYVPKDTDITDSIPDKLLIAGTFLIRVESTLDYKPVIAWSDSQQQGAGLGGMFSHIDMSETYHLRPRMSASIPCADC